jgi:hypothetical protein
MRWHKEGICENNGVMGHPSDGEAEERNVVLLYMYANIDILSKCLLYICINQYAFSFFVKFESNFFCHTVSFASKIGNLDVNLQTIK